MSALNNSALIGASGSTGYLISRSVRLRSSASAYFNRTPASASNRRTWTWSSWVKRGALAEKILFGYGVGGADRGSIAFTSSDNLFLNFFIGGTGYGVTTSAVYRDPSAWYHIVVIWDTTQATASNRIQLYINGVQVTAFSSTTYPTLNLDGIVNNNVAHGIGFYPPGTSAGTFFDGYLTEINFIDGQALTPSSFGETNPITGVWQPRKYNGTYGTNGFYLNFSDPSAATAAAIGKDYSGNGNNWTPNNISVTLGATYDSMIDVPTPWADGGNGRGNYATLNPIYNSGGTRTFANGNLQVTGGAINNNSAELANWQLTSGKWYFEGTVGAIGTASITQIGTNAAVYYGNGTFFPSGSGASYTTNDVIGVAVDIDAGTVQFYKNGVSQGTATVTAGAASFPLFGLGGAATPPIWIANFGQRPFAYTPPSGFRALNTQNLPTPTILKGNQFFDATTYTGTGANQNIVNSGAMQPDLVWIKSRSAATNNRLVDAVRGNNYLVSNSTAAEVASGTMLIQSNGFLVGTDSDINTNAATYVGWQWKEGATQGFDIVTFTTPASGTQTINHSLGVTPAMYFIKCRGAVSNWVVWHRSLASATASYLNLDTTSAAASVAGLWGTGPTSTFIQTLTGSATVASQTYVAYLFAQIAGFSAFGSYTGNGSADGPFVFCGFRPRFVMFKRTDGVADWCLYDSSRNTYNESNLELNPNLSAAEFSTTGTRPVDMLSNGFKLRGSNGGGNASGGTYIFAAFAENPFKYSLAR